MNQELTRVVFACNGPCSHCFMDTRPADLSCRLPCLFYSVDEETGTAQGLPLSLTGGWGQGLVPQEDRWEGWWLPLQCGGNRALAPASSRLRAVFWIKCCSGWGRMQTIPWVQPPTPLCSCLAASCLGFCSYTQFLTRGQDGDKAVAALPVASWRGRTPVLFLGAPKGFYKPQPHNLWIVLTFFFFKDLFL